MLVGVYLDKGRVSDTPEFEETMISETPQRHFLNINKLTNMLSLPVHFLGLFSCSKQLTGRTCMRPVHYSDKMELESNCHYKIVIVVGN